MIIIVLHENNSKIHITLVKRLSAWAFRLTRRLRNYSQKKVLEDHGDGVIPFPLDIGL